MTGWRDWWSNLVGRGKVRVVDSGPATLPDLLPPDGAELIQLPGGPVPVRFRASARAKRVSLRIDPEGGVVLVTLPPRASRAAGLRLLREHAGWVAERLAKLPGALPLADGAEVPLAGRPIRIRHVPQGRGGAWLQDGEIHVSGDAAFLPRRVADLLRREARARLGASVARYAARVGRSPRRLVIKDTRSRWGSCAPDGTVMLCWRLVMAPDWVADYVAAHEAAHLKHMNHGPQFWALVEALTPHRAAATAWLQQHGAGLLRVG